MATFVERQEHQLEIIPPYSIIQCRRADIIEKDGKEVGKTYHRHVRTPGEDVSDDCEELQAVAAALSVCSCLLMSNKIYKDRLKQKSNSIINKSNKSYII
jgi:hypothetical protein